MSEIRKYAFIQFAAAFATNAGNAGKAAAKADELMKEFDKRFPDEHVEMTRMGPDLELRVNGLEKVVGALVNNTPTTTPDEILNALSDRVAAVESTHEGNLAALEARVGTLEQVKKATDQTSRRS